MTMQIPKTDLNALYGALFAEIEAKATGLRVREWKANKSKDIQEDLNDFDFSYNESGNTTLMKIRANSLNT